ncbi:MAG TPA: hypothetical protein VNN09_08410 [Candidatus Competibacteraceae bacterium]|nr:hypothetical protein [Candidatus Competibacteraceae bacterium]
MTLRQRDDGRLRTLLAQECARIMAEEGVKDFGLAKRKAAERLGVTNHARMPGNDEIEQALLEYQRLFKSSRQPEQLRSLRLIAVQAMRFLQRFRPRLVGSVLHGSAGAHSDVNLHIFADTPEEVMLFLMEQGIPFESSQRRLRYGKGDPVTRPVLSFSADGVAIELTVFPPKAEREAPRSPVDGKPMKRAGLAAVEALLREPA